MMSLWTGVERTEVVTAIVVGVASLIWMGLSFYWRLKDLKRLEKRLRIEMLPVVIFTNEAWEVGGKPLRIIWGDQIVSNFAITQLRITNSGGLPINRADFEERKEIKIRLEGVSEIYEEKIAKRTPEYLKPTISARGNQISIKPILLNPGDSFIVQSAIGLEKTNAKPRISASGRISGISEIEVSELSPVIPRQGIGMLEIVERILAALMILALLILIIILAFPVPPKPPAGPAPIKSSFQSPHTPPFKPISQMSCSLYLVPHGLLRPCRDGCQGLANARTVRGSKIYRLPAIL